MSITARLSYGIIFDNDFAFPWRNTPKTPWRNVKALWNDNGNNLWSWWTRLQGFSPSLEVWDTDGNYIQGLQESEIKKREKLFISEYKAWENSIGAIPDLPIDIISCAHWGSVIMVISDDKLSYESQKHGEPNRIYPIDLELQEDYRKTLVEFCEKYQIEHAKPNWYLSYCHTLDR